MKIDATTDLRTWGNIASVIAAAGVYYYSPATFTPEVAVYWLTGTGITNIVMGFFKDVKLS